MRSCSNCQHDEIHGAIFCSNCGTKLINGFPQHEVHSVKEMRQELQDSWISLVILDNGEILSDLRKNELSIGRTSEGQMDLPDIDLSQYDAYSQGVSRIHCVLKRIGEDQVVVDLKSSNGTFLNGSQLDANIETPFKDKDVLSLGRFNIRLLLQYKNTSH